MKKYFHLAILSALMACAACSKYTGRGTPYNIISGSNNEIIFEDMKWDSTGDSLVFSMDLGDFSKILLPGDIAKVIVIRQGYENIAGYMEWGRNNLYKYEIVNNRIVLYWQIDQGFEYFMAPVTVLVKLK